MLHVLSRGLCLWLGWTLLITDLAPGLFPLPPGDEICDNGIDDDQDGLIDLWDEDCACEQVDHASMIPNPSFEEMDCCPATESQMNCATGWVQASAATTDFMHHCGFMGGNFFAPPTPFPDGQGVLRFINGHTEHATEGRIPYKEYAGVCLRFPMQKDSTYWLEFDLGFIEKDFSPDINISIYGTESCGELPFSNDFNCPSLLPEWFLLTETEVDNGGGSHWARVRLSITPDRDIAALAIGPDCEMGEHIRALYYFLDNIVLNTPDAYDFHLRDHGPPCSEHFILAVGENPQASYQWYKEGIALVGEREAELSRMYGQGNYQLRIIENGQCRLSQDYPYFFDLLQDTVQATLCAGNSYDFHGRGLTEAGIYYDTLQTEAACDSVIRLELSVQQELRDTVTASILAGTSYAIGQQELTTEGEHRVWLRSTHGCDSLVLVRLSLTRLYIPTAFSPNEDGMNESFGPIGLEEDIVALDLQVFNRWGRQVFQGRAWDGRTGGIPQPAGVYVYLIQATTRDGEQQFYSGTFSLIR